MPREWKCAVVGTGTVGEWHVRTISKLPNLKLVAICDIDPNKARAALDKNGLKLPTYTDAREMYAAHEIDAVHVCTPSGDHKGPALMAMEHGKNVVVEKPMEIYPERIDEMVSYAGKKGVRLAGIFQNRWNESIRVIRDAVVEKRFGKVSWAGLFTPWYRTDKYYADGGWRGTWKTDGGGAVMNQGVHQVDVMQWVVGPVKTVSAFAGSRIHPAIEVEDTLTCALQFQDGAFGTFVSTTGMFPGGPTRLEIGGEYGTAISENGLKRFEFKSPTPKDAEILRALDPARAKSSGGGTSATDVGLDLHAQNIMHIYESWDNNKDAMTFGPEARKAVAIIQAMYESVRKNGSPVDVK